MFNTLETRIVLVQPSHPGNIGSAARAMKTMGLEKLFLVNPRNFPAAEARILAAGADELLANAQVVDSLDEAIADCQLIFGTSARERSLPWPVLNPRQAAELILKSTAKTAILFGREDKGLRNDELQRCQYHIQIPANPAYTSLNLAAAVQVICYELRMHLENQSHAKSDTLKKIGNDSAIADNQKMELFFTHLDQTLQQLNFLNPKNPNQIMSRLRRLFYRAKPDTTEVDIVRGILSKIQWHLQQKDESQ